MMLMVNLKNVLKTARKIMTVIENKFMFANIKIFKEKCLYFRLGNTRY